MSVHLRSCFRGAILCTTASLLPAVAQAQDPTQKTEEIEIEVQDASTKSEHLSRASHMTTHQEWETHLAQSAPEALARTPGVYVQKTAHAQASPYLRGLTGQRTVILFDKIRLNTSTYRQGPNQYFFTIDHQSIDSIEVLRGSASTLYGSDALGGAIMSHPKSAKVPENTPGFWWNAQAQANTHSADSRIGARVSGQLGWGSKFSAIGGIGYRDVGQLQTAGPILSPVDQSPHKSPGFEDDLRTQMGTGYKELAWDLRLRFSPSSHSAWTVAFYRYQQRDAPRTDKCPPLEGRAKECLTYKKQDRDLAYLGLEQEFRSSFWKKLSARLSLSRQYEWRQWTIDNLIPNTPGGTQNDGIDQVWTYGSLVHLKSRSLSLSPNWSLSLKAGLDAYYDQIKSRSAQRFTDTTQPVVIEHPRGQYVEGSSYLNAGAFVQSEFRYKSRLWAELGARTTLVHANVPENLGSDTHGVSSQYLPVGGHAGLHWRLTKGLRWQNNLDHGFRAPNLDDLSGRQQVGPGFQFENHALSPERSWSLDSGLRYLSHRLDFSIFVFHTRLLNAIVRAPRTVTQCPDSQTGPEGCLASRTRFTLVNLGKPAQIWGSEAAFRYRMIRNLELSGALSFAYGQSPSPILFTRGDQESAKTVPLSRVPPFNGHLAWSHKLPRWSIGQFRWGGAVYWATAQRRLALADQADARIPLGGTPGFVVANLNLGWQINKHAELALMLENLFDRPYRHHGSSVNGAGRSIRARFRIMLGSH